MLDCYFLNQLQGSSQLTVGAWSGSLASGTSMGKTIT
jgi:hypothetical protein